MAIKAIFWDNDGVLVDTERLYFEATRTVLACAGIHLSKEQYIELFLVHGKGAWDLAAERGIAQTAIDQLRAERNRLYGDLLLKEQLVIDGVREVLEVLYPAYVMGIVTSCLPDHFSIIHRTTGLLRYFSFVLAHGDYTRSKPDPEPYLLAVERSGCRKDECLVIEDSERGLSAALAAGLRCIVVPTELTRSSNFTGAYQVLSCVRELLEELPC